MQVNTHRQTYQAKTNFKGFRNKDARALLALDLDGTLANGTNEDVKRVLELARKANATLCYATGRTIQDFPKLQAKLLEEGVNLPIPQHMVANNGQFVYENINGQLVEDMNWRRHIIGKTGFDREKVLQTIDGIAHHPKYLHPEQDAQKLRSLPDFEARKKEDPQFWDSQITYYEWNPSIHFAEYLLGHNVEAKGLKREVRSALQAQGIKPKFIYRKYDKKTMDECPEAILRKSRPIREDSAGAMQALFVCPADKADGVEYLGRKLDIPNEEILTAGNDSNDWSLASFSKKGSIFVCVGNAYSSLIDFAKKIHSDTIIFAQEHGAKGIAEGMEKALSKYRKD